VVRQSQAKLLFSRQILRFLPLSYLLKDSTRHCNIQEVGKPFSKAATLDAPVSSPVKVAVQLNEIKETYIDFQK